MAKGKRQKAKIKVKMVLVDPADPHKIGDEAIKLAKVFGKLTGAQYDQLTTPIRRGFAWNFANEGTPEGDWEGLHDWTVEEREQFLLQGRAGGLVGTLVPGFSAAHPIQQVTGSYMRSWVDKDDQHHAIDVTFFGGTNTMEILEGSTHPHLMRLYGKAPSSGGMSVPPRPVHIISDRFADAIGHTINAIAEQYATKVK